MLKPSESCITVFFSGLRNLSFFLNMVVSHGSILIWTTPRYYIVLSHFLQRFQIEFKSWSYQAIHVYTIFISCNSSLPVSCCFLFETPLSAFWKFLRFKMYIFLEKYILILLFNLYVWKIILKIKNVKKISISIKCEFTNIYIYSSLRMKNLFKIKGKYILNSKKIFWNFIYLR